MRINIKHLFILVVCASFIPLNVFAQESHHGGGLSLGTVKILGKDFSITRFGKLAPGKEGAFEVTSSADVSSLSAYLWLESKEGKKLSAPSKGIPEKGKLHFHLMLKEESEPEKVVLRIREADKDERAALPLGEMDHSHNADGHKEVEAEHAHGHKH